jgi:hypothetical protein
MSANWTKQRRDELVGELRTTPALYRLVRQTTDGLPRVDKGAIAAEERFDGKFLLRTSDDTFTPTALALAYKQLSEVERGWRDLKGSLKLRPVSHYREDRIRGPRRPALGDDASPAPGSRGTRDRGADRFYDFELPEAVA